MTDIADKLSSYQIFSSLVPGSVFVVAAAWLRMAPIENANPFAIAVICYFIGLSLNRLGAIGTYRLSDDQIKEIFILYRDVESSKAVYDTLVMYRTFCVAMFCLFILSFVPYGRDLPEGVAQWHIALSALLLLALFISACRQQLRYLELLIAGERAKNPQPA